MSNMTKSLAAVGVAAVLAVGGAIAVTSANASGSTAAAQPPAGQASFQGTGGGMGRFGAMSVIGNALHGDFTVAEGTATVVERLQKGSVTDVSISSITVKSTDGFTATYAVGSGLDVSSFAAGTSVTVLAKVSGNTATAMSVTAAADNSSGPGGLPGGAPPNGGQAGQGAPGGSMAGSPTI
jgi:VCBS repeat-containing protein